MSYRLKAILLAVVLVLVGTAAAIAVTRGMQRATDAVATVNGEVVYASDLEREVAALARQYNIDLSARRAQSVKNYLVQAGVPTENLETRGAGPDEPRADNNTPDGQQKNRRIEFKILSQ